MRRELIDLAAALADRGEPFALATVIARAPPISAQVGDAALVTSDGGFHGWVGGSCTRPTVIAEARRRSRTGSRGWSRSIPIRTAAAARASRCFP